MTSSDSTWTRANQILGRLALLLDEGLISQQIDEPIDQAFARISVPNAPTHSHSQLQTAITDLVQLLYAGGATSGRQLARSQARDEAITILEQAYGGHAVDGYYHAVLDAADPEQSGLALVLARLTDLVKARRRQMYMRWVAARHIDPTNWQTKRAMAQVLLERCRHRLPRPLRDCPPEQMADHVLALMMLDLGSEAQIRQLLVEAT